MIKSFYFEYESELTNISRNVTLYESEKKNHRFHSYNFTIIPNYRLLVSDLGRDR